MIFEGSEKKVEIVVNGRVGSLRSKGESFWRHIVETAQAQILSKISNTHCDAYLLSESSLFVWDDRLTMITCGRTMLVNAIFEFLNHIPVEYVDALIYQRKNEYFPRHQFSDFYEDVLELKKRVNGRGFRFGDADGHHLFMFHTERPYIPLEEDSTLEILMYNLQGKAKDVFRLQGQSAAEIREFMGSVSALDGFKIDDYTFEPFGYSLNALKDEQYCTIHVTPQEISPYVSFETNLRGMQDYGPVVQSVIEAFQPSSFDVVLFKPQQHCELTLPGFVRKALVREKLTCGYEVCFNHFFKPAVAADRALPLELTL